MFVCTGSTLFRVQAKQGVFAAKADAKSPSSRGSTLGVGDLHQVDMAISGNKVHAAKWVRLSAGLPEGGRDIVP